MISTIKQTGPNCGIYALINRLCTLNGVHKTSKKNIDKIVLHLLDENKLKKGREGLIGYTLVGEFFDFSTFQKFIKVNIGAIHNNITNIKCDKEDNYEIELKAINNFTDQELISSIKKRESTVLFSIYKHPSQKKDKQHINKDIKIDQVISHWVAICDYDEKSSSFIVSDSNSKKTKMYTGEQLIDRNNQLTNKKFYWINITPFIKGGCLILIPLLKKLKN
ncbi:hypothetical protein ACFC3Y_25490 [Bacillus wiedmannii]|uniref:hypothetical protein n=1 Tax=Bacillus wiedmannii TaxID=1890302 RepID=UPI0035D8D716